MSTVDTGNNVSQSLLDSMNPKKANQSSVDAAQDRFMTLLITQMKNQDPLNPLDNAQVTSQLAQLSTVTGIDKLNSTLETLKGSYQSSQSLQAAGMIGHAVLVPGSTINLGESGGYLGVELGAPADNVVVSIKDGAGNVVHKMNVGAKDAGIATLQWDGMTDAGTAATPGAYTFDVEATRGGEKLTTGVTSLMFGDVGSVSTGSQGIKLNVPGLGAIDMEQVRQIL